jgi:hypothetical protein
VRCASSAWFTVPRSTAAVTVTCCSCTEAPASVRFCSTARPARTTTPVTGLRLEADAPRLDGRRAGRHAGDHEPPVDRAERAERRPLHAHLHVRQAGARGRVDHAADHAPRLRGRLRGAGRPLRVQRDRSGHAERERERGAGERQASRLHGVRGGRGHGRWAWDR